MTYSLLKERLGTDDDSLPGIISAYLIDPKLTNDSSQLKSLQSAEMKKLDFFIQEQTQSNWCWAAVSSSVGNYYQTGSWTQCDVASFSLSRDCCDNAESCNIYNVLDKPLKITHSYNYHTFTIASENDILQEINMGRPFCLRCAWSNGGAHFVVIYGIGNGCILVADSIFGCSINNLESFPSFYYGGGRWTHSYFTIKNEEGSV